MNTCATTGGVMLLLSLTAAFGWVMTAEQIPLQLTQFFMSFTPNGTVFLLVVILIALIIGCFLTPTAALAIMVPILTPIAQGFGINLLHFGLVLLPALSLGHFTPPVGLCLYIGSSISGIPIAKLTRPVLPFLLAMVTVCVLLAVFPQISLFLPRLFFR
jgi:C4-dicarboxylate transporter DctM subunit